MHRATSWTALAISATLLLALGSSADASGKHPIKVGPYQAAPDTQGQYVVGEWSITKQHGRYRMSAYPEADGIYYPDAQKCGGITTPPLTKPVYTIRKNGSFRIVDTEQVLSPKYKPWTQHLTWSGHWTNRHTVEGTITISIKGHCTDRRYWSGNPDPGPA
jgi:hypothetical protein